MAEKLSLELELLDKVGGPAKKAAAALRGVETQAKKAQGALDFSKELGRTKAQLDKIKMDPKGFHDLIKAQKSLRDEREKLKKSMEGGHGGFFGSLKSGIKEHLGLNGLGGKMASASFWGHIGASAVVGIGEGFLEGAHKAVEILYDGIKEAFGAIAKEQELQAGYNLTLGGKKNAEGKTAGDEAREAIEHWSKKTAFSASQNQEMMLPLFRAGLTGKAATTAYASALDLAAGRGKGADKDAVSSAVELFARIQQKGGITSKMLAGVGLGKENVPAFFRDLGKQLHVSATAAQKMAAAGKVDPQLISNSITDAINKQQEGKAGSGGEEAGKSLFGQWNKLKELPEEFLRKLIKSPALPILSKAFDGILEKLDPDSPTGKRIMGTLMSSFNRLATAASDAITPENIEKFVNGLTSAVSAVGDLASGLRKVIELLNGDTLSKYFQNGDKGDKSVEAIDLMRKAGTIDEAKIQKLVYGMGESERVDLVNAGKKSGYDYSRFLPKTFERAKQPSFDSGELTGFESDQRQERDRKNNAARMRAIVESMDMVNHVTIVAAPGDDPTHTHQRAAQEIGAGASKLLERAVAEAGAAL